MSDPTKTGEMDVMTFSSTGICAGLVGVGCAAS